MESASEQTTDSARLLELIYTAEFRHDIARAAVAVLELAVAAEAFRWLPKLALGTNLCPAGGEPLQRIPRTAL